MNKFLPSINLDFLGFSASMLCAIHCALLPFVMTVGVMGGLSWLNNPWIEISFIIISVVLAMLSLYPTYKKKHANAKPLQIAAIGFFLLFVSRISAHGSMYEIIPIVLGGVLIAISHFINWRLLKAYKQG